MATETFTRSRRFIRPVAANSEYRGGWMGGQSFSVSARIIATITRRADGRAVFFFFCIGSVSDLGT